MRIPATLHVARINRVFPASRRWHPLLMEALSGIADVGAVGFVWWHCDMVHSVAPAENQHGWGNVMYIPAASWCPRDEQFSASVREAFRAGSRPGDFPQEHCERTWIRRFTEAELNTSGRRGLNLG